MTRATEPLEQFAVYRCTRITRQNPIPRDEVQISVHPDAMTAMDEANRLKRGDRAHSYVVGLA